MESSTDSRKYLRITAYGTVALALFAALNYFYPIRKGIDDFVDNKRIKKEIKEQKSLVNLSIDKEIYKGERSSLVTMYIAAKKVPNSYTKGKSLKKVVKTALTVRDYNIAILAADDIPNIYTKGDALTLIVKEAVKNEQNFGFAALAAEKVPNTYTRGTALNMVIDAIEKSMLQPEKKTKDPDLRKSVESNKD